jgi:allophanate hydrolase subunit 2
MASLRVLRAGPGTTVQDAGRCGWLRFGVTRSGPMDWIAHARANILAGNAPVAAAIEVGIGGIELGWAVRARRSRSRAMRPPFPPPGACASVPATG